MKIKTKSIKLNMILNVLLTITSLITPLITFPYITNVLTPIEIGTVSFAQSFVSYFSTFALLGVGIYGVRACAVVKDNKMQLSKVVHEILLILLITSAIAYTALYICIFTIPKLYDEKVLYFIISSSIILSSIGISWLFAAMEDYTYITIRSILFNLLAVILMVTLIKKPEDYLLYAGISVIAGVGSNLLNIIYARKYISFKWIGKYELKKHIKPLLTFFIMGAIILVYTNLDKTMLGFMVHDDNFSVGIYETSVKYYRIITSLCTAIPAVLLPRLSYYIQKKEMTTFYNLLSKAMSFILVVSIPIATYFVVMAKQSVLFLANVEYMNSIVPMQIMIPAIIFVGITNIIGIQMLVPLGEENKVSLSVLCGAIVDVVLNACLINYFAGQGNAAIATAISTLCAEFSVLIAQLIIARKHIAKVVRKINYFKIIAINVLFAGVSIGVSFIKFNISDIRLKSFVELAVTASICFVAYLIILLVCREPIAMETLSLLKGKIIKRKVVETIVENGDAESIVNVDDEACEGEKIVVDKKPVTQEIMQKNEINENKGKETDEV